jgi:predicted nucleic acid-binding protein
VTNTLVLAEKRGRTRAADTERALTLLASLPIEIDARTAEKSVKETLTLARTHALTTYDAAYLELCLREDLPIATFDRELFTACAETGVKIFKPG